MMTSPGQTIVFSVLSEAIGSTTGLDPSFLSIAYAGATLVAGLLLALTSTRIDSLGPFRAILIGAAGILIGGIWLATTAGSALATLIGFLLLRFWGQGWLSLSWGLVASSVPEEWIGRSVGASHALGRGLMGVFVLLFGLATQWWTWQQSLVTLTSAAAILSVATGFAVRSLSRYSPLIDHGVGRRPVQHVARPHPGRSVSRVEAFRDLRFLSVVIALLIVGVVNTGMVFHHFPIVRVAGVDDRVILWVIPWFTAGSMLAAVTCGYMLDRRPTVQLLPIGLCLPLVGWVGISSTSSPGFLITTIYAMFVGASIGWTKTVEAGALARIFGISNLGGIRGASTMANVMGTALGPMVLAVLLVSVRSGHLAIMLFVLLPIALAPVACLLWSRGEARARIASL